MQNLKIADLKKAFPGVKWTRVGKRNDPEFYGDIGPAHYMVYQVDEHVIYGSISHRTLRYDAECEALEGLRKDLLAQVSESLAVHKMLHSSLSS